MKLPINNKRFIYFSQVKTSEKTYTQEFVLDEENKLVAIKRTSGDSCAVYPLVRKEMADKIVYKTSIGEYVIFTKDGNVFGEGYYETDIDGLNDIINSDFIEKTYIFDINGNVQKEVIRSSTNIITTTTINNDGSESFVADDGKSTIRTITKYGDNPLEFILSVASIENGNSGFKEAGAIKRYVTYDEFTDSYYISESFKGLVYWKERLSINEQGFGTSYSFRERNSGLYTCCFDENGNVLSCSSTKKNKSTLTKIYMYVDDVNLD